MSLILGVEFVIVATLLAVLAFFVLDTASRAQGRLRLFGKALGIWLIALIAAAFLVLVIAPLIMPRPHQPMHDVWLNES